MANNLKAPDPIRNDNYCCPKCHRSDITNRKKLKPFWRKQKFDKNKIWKEK